MKKIFLLSIIIIFIGEFTNANNSKIDTSYFRQSIDNAVNLFNSNRDSAMLQLLQIEKSCIKMNYDEGLAECMGQIGVLQFQGGNYPEALEQFNQSQKLYEKLNIEKSVAAIHLSIGAVYTNIGDYPKALKHIHIFLDFYENTDSYFALGSAYLTASGVYINNQEFDLGHEYIEKAIKEYTKIDHKWGLCGALLNKGMIYHQQKKYEQCIFTLKKVIEKAEEINSPDLVANAMVFIGSSYLELKDYQKAEEFLFKVLKLDHVNKKVLAECYFFIGDLYQTKGEYQLAINYVQKVVTESEKYDLQEELQMAYDRLAYYYSELKTYSQAFEMKKLSYNLRDSLFNEEKSMQMKKLEAVYQSAKKQQKIENLENQNQIQKLKLQKTKITYTGITVILLVISVVVILLFRNSRLKIKSENIKLEQRLLRSQMNPHFIFNAISAIQHYIVKNRALEASSYLSNFAKLMRSILNNSKVELVTLETEKQTLEDYLTLQSIRLDGNLVYTIKGISEIDSDELAIPPMLLQPFIENAIEHGILKKIDQKGKIIINFTEKENKLHVEIIDDGIGRDYADKMKDKEHISFATNITKSRIKSMKQSYKKNIFFDIIDLKNSHNSPIGTKVIFELPLVYI
jgi:tetratricopeptide (TPR) repeat protein